MLRQQHYGVYALRFEDISVEDRARLHDFAQALIESPRSG